jgi:hypothetical protein
VRLGTEQDLVGGKTEFWRASGITVSFHPALSAGVSGL